MQTLDCRTPSPLIRTILQLRRNVGEWLPGTDSASWVWEEVPPLALSITGAQGCMR